MPEKHNKDLELQNESLESKADSSIDSGLLKQFDGADVKDLMEGMGTGEVSKKVGEQKDGDAKAGGKKAGKTTVAKKTPKKPKHRPLPSSNVMRRTVIKEMKSEEAGMIREAKKLVKKPHEYAEKIKQIRSLRQKLRDFMRSAFDAIKSSYLKMFGKRHGIEEKEGDK